VTYTDSTGKQRWRVVEGGLREARALRGELLGKLARGEKIAPGRVTFAEYADSWLVAQTELRERTREKYESAVRLHLKPRFGPPSTRIASPR
jgi:hypothetical protein